MGQAWGVMGLLELAQEAQVAIKEQTQVVHAVTQHGEAVWAHTEREADVLLGVESHVADNVGVDLATTGYLKPTTGQRPTGVLDPPS